MNDDRRRPLVHPDGTPIEEPPEAPPSWATRLLRFIIDAEQWPLVKVIVLAAGVLTWVAGLANQLWLEPKRQAEREKDVAIREGRFHAPAINLRIDPWSCELRNVDARPIVEADLSWRIYVIDTAKPRDPLRWRVGPDGTRTSELKPHAGLSAKFPGANFPALCPDNQTCADADCAIIVECVAAYHREADRKLFSESALAYAEPPRCALFETAWGEQPAKVRKALALLPTARAMLAAEIEQIKPMMRTWQRGGPQPDR